MSLKMWPFIFPSASAVAHETFAGSLPGNVLPGQCVCQGPCVLRSNERNQPDATSSHAAKAR